MIRWKFLTAVGDGQPLTLGGVDVWQRQWTNCGRVVLPDPAYPGQTHAVGVWEIQDGGRTIRFAAGEFSNGVWGFFLPEDGGEDDGRSSPFR